MSKAQQKFCTTLAKQAQFEKELLGGFEYRDLGISDATQCQYHADWNSHFVLHQPDQRRR
ncbi:MAG: hypothetical protein ACI845_002533 [Gammaproteobacteria bacterium]|jgi:hypothetical protein